MLQINKNLENNQHTENFANNDDFMNFTSEQEANSSFWNFYLLLMLPLLSLLAGLIVIPLGLWFLDDTFLLTNGSRQTLNSSTTLIIPAPHSPTQPAAAAIQDSTRSKSDQRVE